MLIPLLLLIGVVAGALDILPMVKRKLDPYSIASAFVFHLIAPFFVYDTVLPLPALLQGGLVYLLFALPVAILAAKDDKKAAPIMLVTSLVIGMIAGQLIHLL